MWPHFDAVASKCAALYADYKAGHDIAKYTTNGTEDRRVPIKKVRKSESPTKGHGVTGTSGTFK